MLRLSRVVASLRARSHGSIRTVTKITYSFTDEAPMLATYSLLPIVRRFLEPHILVEKVDISLAARILSQFPERLTAAQAQHGHDGLAALGALVKTPGANVIKLPNISASVPQLLAAIAELQAKGFSLPAYTQSPATPEEKDAAARYGRVLGSAVNPVLREGNSDRRVAAPVKAFAQKHPHKLLPWTPASKTRVVHMQRGDFYASEQSVIVPAACVARIEHVCAATGAVTLLKGGVKLGAGEIADAAFMSAAALREFYEGAFSEAKREGVLASLHLKATMMKVSDPILFGHAVKVFFAPVFAKHGAALAAAGANPNNGWADVLAKVAALPPAQRSALEADIAAAYAARPALAMVDSRKGITNLHVPSDVIVDASMPCVVRDAGMWNAADKLQDTHAIIPDRCYATMFGVVLEDVRLNGQFNVATMGSTANVGLMAQKAEEYGSHDKTFEVKAAGTVRVVVEGGAPGAAPLLAHAVAAGDVWRMCTTKEAAIADWVKLAVTRARASGSPAIFWLDAARAHDANVMARARALLAAHDTAGLAISFAAPQEAMRATCARARAGQDTISVTGNVLRDYLTDLFPILELGTSAKMLSIVPMMAGGGMYETGAGGSAPKHVQQFVGEGHLRWDSLGEYLALAVSLEDLGAKGAGNARARLLAATLTAAVGKLLDLNQSPSRKVRELDNRGSAFFIALHWATALAAHDASFKPLAQALAAGQAAILKDLTDCQGSKVDIGGYYMPDEAKATAAMRPSATLNAIIDGK